MSKDRALPKTDKGAVDAVIMMGEGVDESAQPKPYADGEEAVHGSCPTRLRMMLRTG